MALRCVGLEVICKPLVIGQLRVEVPGSDLEPLVERTAEVFGPSSEQVPSKLPDALFHAA